MPGETWTRPTVSTGRPWLARSQASHASASTALPEGELARALLQPRLGAGEVAARQRDPPAEREAAGAELVGVSVPGPLVGQEQRLAEVPSQMGRPGCYFEGLRSGIQRVGSPQVRGGVVVAVEHGEHPGPLDPGRRRVRQVDGLVQEAECLVGVESGSRRCARRRRASSKPPRRRRPGGRGPRRPAGRPRIERPAPGPPRGGCTRSAPRRRSRRAPRARACGRTRTGGRLRRGSDAGPPLRGDRGAVPGERR